MNIVFNPQVDFLVAEDSGGQVRARWDIMRCGEGNDVRYYFTDGKGNASPETDSWGSAMYYLNKASGKAHS